ncbi:hypothetical protein PMZ80_002935 [Knufia obscura]|uniref:Uncharacterized protein n=1 Tax=Knufia obscura TaxID=1635080 RepID=A0ABR0RZ87_9EURO|nr:hypothetical protein PMZ80_002935 [Knufia obscura]
MLTNYQNPMIDQSTSSLLSLPAELRVKIWRYQFKNGENIPTELRPTDRRSGTHNKAFIKLSAQALRTCQVIRKEGTGVLFEENVCSLSVGYRPYEHENKPHAPFVFGFDCALKKLDCAGWSYVLEQYKTARKMLLAVVQDWTVRESDRAKVRAEHAFTSAKRILLDAQIAVDASEKHLDDFVSWPSD